ncbi:MAG: exonuclease subunit SbcD [Oleispira antarctica]|nr:exonuclease subunit SbcD [Oleispira antarctica]MBQ0793911.1 exonuclease subunit SbcD [Oleispira antarctica]
MRIIHTSDWHLGQFFINKSRSQEHQKFISWLLDQVLEHDVDAVIIAGDIFDTGSPPSYARELYNQFVIGMNTLGRQLIILAGNHDSVSTLNESKNILAQLNTQVIAAASEDLASQVLTLKDKQGEVGAIVCAIPYLRPRDIMQSRSGESGQQKQQALGQAIGQHYQEVFELAEKQRDELSNSFPTKSVPIIATGHLTAMGVTTSDSVRDIYIGSLEAFPAKDFPAADYIALGHIHRPQRVAKTEHIRYCGSPIPLSFDELGSASSKSDSSKTDSSKAGKQVLLVDFKDGKLNTVEPLFVPLFQPMQVIKGDLASIEQQLATLSDIDPDGLPIWLSIEVDTQDYLNDLQQRIQALTADMHVEILQLRRARKQQQQRIEREDKELLAELTPEDVFERRLATEQFETDEEKERLIRLKTAFTSIVNELETELNDED